MTNKRRTVQPRPMRIFAGGIATETNTFCGTKTDLSDFQVQRGREVLEGHFKYPSLNLSETWGKRAQAHGADFVFSLMAWAEPSGTTTRHAYEYLRDELLADLEAAMPVEVVLLNLHGAMVAEGYPDCEEDLIKRIRSMVGRAAIVAVEFDLHANLSWTKVAAANIAITYKEYPHVDVNDVADELFDQALSAALGRGHPTMALFDLQIVGLYPTTREPLRTLVEDMKRVETQPGVLSVSFAHGFQFADVPHVGSKVLVVTDDNPVLAKHLAREIGLRIYAHRRELGFESIALPLEEAFAKAMASKRRPIVIADQADNPGAGGPGDSTFSINHVLKHGIDDVAVGMVCDAYVVGVALEAGVGSEISVRLGGKLAPASGDPVELRAMVIAARKDYMHGHPQESGADRLYPLGDVVSLRVGTLDIVVSSQRCQCFSPTLFTDLKIDPSAKRLLVIKSMQHFHSAFAPVAGEVIYMSGPGAVSPDPRLIRHCNVQTDRLYPWVADPLAIER
jgi:microcystin degradation protein MlrC